jgi:hypothetical protein
MAGYDLQKLKLLFRRLGKGEDCMEKRCVDILVSAALIAAAIKLIATELVELAKFLAVQTHDLLTFFLSVWR